MIGAFNKSAFMPPRSRHWHWPTCLHQQRVNSYLGFFARASLELLPSYEGNTGCKTFLRCGIVPQSLFLGFWELQGKESHFSIDHFLWFQSVVPCKNMGMTTWVHYVDVATIIHIINMSCYQNWSHTWYLCPSLWMKTFKMTKYECSAHFTCMRNRCISHFHAKVHTYMMPLKGVFSSLGMWDAGKLCAASPQCAVHSVLHDVSKMWTDISLHCIDTLWFAIMHTLLPAVCIKSERRDRANSSRPCAILYFSLSLHLKLNLSALHSIIRMWSL